MKQQIPLVDKTYIIKKFQGKGGWTFVRIPEISPSKNTPFGWVRVRGTIDNYEIKSYNLQSMGNGTLFLPIKSEIRKSIRKGVGDSVHLVLYEDTNPVELPEELKHCFVEEPHVYEVFLSYSDGEKKTILDWIYSAKTDKTKIDRIAKTINDIVQRNTRNEPI